MAILDARSVATKQARAFLDISLTEVLVLADRSKSISNEHSREDTTCGYAFQSRNGGGNGLS